MDLRIPSGWFFVLLGSILLAMGIFVGTRAPLATVNINFYAGMAMAIFGGALLWLAKRKS